MRVSLDRFIDFIIRETAILVRSTDKSRNRLSYRGHRVQHFAVSCFYHRLFVTTTGCLPVLDKDYGPLLLLLIM